MSEEDRTRHLRRDAKAPSVVSRSPMPPREERRRPHARRRVAESVGDPSQCFHPTAVTCGRVPSAHAICSIVPNSSRDAGWPCYRAMPGCERWRLRLIVESTACRTPSDTFVQDRDVKRAIDAGAPRRVGHDARMGAQPARRDDDAQAGHTTSPAMERSSGAVRAGDRAAAVIRVRWRSGA